MKQKNIFLISTLCIYKHQGAGKTLRALISYVGGVNLYISFLGSIDRKSRNWYKKRFVQVFNFSFPHLPLGIETYLYELIVAIKLLMFKPKLHLIVSTNSLSFFYLLGKRIFNLKNPTLVIFQNVISDYYLTIKNKPLWGDFFIFMERYCYLNSDRVVCVSNGVKKQLIKYYGRKKGVIVLHNPSVSSSPIPKELSKTKYKILFVSHDNRRKGVQIVNDLAKIYLNNNKIVFYHIGSDRWGIKLQKNFYDLGPLSHETLMKYLKRATLLIHPSYNEGHPFIVIEALSVGLPVVASYKSNVEIVDNSNYASRLIVKGFEAKKYKEKIDTVLKNSSVYKKCSLDSIKASRANSMRKWGSAIYKIIFEALNIN